MAKPANHIIRWGMTILLLMLATLVKAQDTIAVDRPLPWNGREVDKAKLVKQIEKNDVDSTKAPNHIGSGTTDGNTLTIFDENTKNLAKKENKPSVEKGVWMPKPKKGTVVCHCLAGSRTDIQQEILETTHHLWRFLGLFLRISVEQHDV